MYSDKILSAVSRKFTSSTTYSENNVIPDDIEFDDPNYMLPKIVKDDDIFESFSMK